MPDHERKSVFHSLFITNQGLSQQFERVLHFKQIIRKVPSRKNKIIAIFCLSLLLKYARQRNTDKKKKKNIWAHVPKTEK